MLDEETKKVRSTGRGGGLAALRIDEHPYAWQVEALKKWNEANSRGVIVAPTASGKTNLAFMAMREKALSTIVIVPTEAIMWRWVNDLQARGIRTGVFYGKDKTQGEDCDVAIINSVQNRPSILADYDFIIIDEIHHLAAEESAHLIPLMHGKRVLGMTSTLDRSDEREVLVLYGTDDLEKAKGSYVAEQSIPVVYTLKLIEAVKQGVVANVEMITRGVQMHCTCEHVRMGWKSDYSKKMSEFGHSKDCERGRILEMSEEISKLWGMLHPKDMLDLRKMGGAGMKCISLIQKRKKAFSMGYNKPPEVLKIIQEHPNERVLVFCEAIDGIVAAKKYLEAFGVRCELYHSKMKPFEKKKMFDDWRDGKFPVLLSVRALDEGINVPECKVAIVIASGRGRRQWIQRIGRILRKTGKMAQLYIVYLLETGESDFPKQAARLIKGID
jgi:superfamily II DNA or RNA helicase